jgi:hypothetical protein
MYRRVVPLFLVALAGTALAGCGVVTVHHVPEPGSISSSKIPDLHGSQPLDIKNGQPASGEIDIGTVGVGKVVGNLQQWTAAMVSAVKSQLSQRGATIVNDAPRFLSLSMKKAEIRAIPIIGGATSTIILTVTTADGFIADFEGSSSSIAPLSAINGAATDAVKKLLEDPTIGTYLRHWPVRLSGTENRHKATYDSMMR